MTSPLLHPQSRIDLETKDTETLGLILNYGTSLISNEIFFGQSRPTKMCSFQNTSIAALGELAHRLQRRTACNTSPPALSKIANGVWKRSNLRLLDLPINFH